MNRTVRGMIVRGIKFIPLTNIPLTKHLVQEGEASGVRGIFIGRGFSTTADRIRSDAVLSRIRVHSPAFKALS